TNFRGDDHAWFPRCSVYNSRFSNQVELFERMASSQHFNRIKELFQVKDLSSFRKKYQDYLSRIEEGSQKYHVSFEYQIPPMEKVINIGKIGTIE
ncbi:MAG: hypothetical protein KJI70_00005, partial [Patescibacteria group bacterium]|nr:hypothetical protein [Patescibacteria group bacterium]